MASECPDEAMDGSTLPARRVDGVVELLGSRCRACAVVTFPPQERCPRCGAGEAERCALGRRGTLWTWTVQLFPPKPPFRGGDDFVPFGVGFVELPGEVRVEARLTESDPDVLHIGMAMELVARPVPGREDEDVFTIAFAPAPDGVA